MERRSVVEYLENFLRRGRECAYVQRRGYRAVRWNYGRVAGVAFQFTRELEKRGIGKGERVLLWGSNSAEWVAAFFGCALRGAVVVPIDDAGTAGFMQHIDQLVESRLLLCSREHAQPFLSISATSTSPPILILEDLQTAVADQSAAPYDAAEIAAADTL